MQQTTQYKLNKPETDDPIAIAPLNENMDKIEAALGTKAGAADTAQQFTALAQRVTALEGKKIAVGTYTGDNNLSKTIQLPFAPTFVLLQWYSRLYVIHKDHPIIDSGTQATAAKITGSTMTVANTMDFLLNNPTTNYVFLAFS